LQLARYDWSCGYYETTNRHARWHGDTADRARWEVGTLANPLGRFWIPEGDVPGLKDAIAEELASDVYRAQAGDIGVGDVVLDCGANVGTFTRMCLDRGTKLVIAVEPAPQTVCCLNRTFAEEIDAGSVIVYNKGLWDRQAELQFQLFPGLSEANTFVLHPEIKGGPSIPVTTIDQLVIDLNLSQLDLIKMDIEGAEQRALAGATNVIRKFMPKLAISAHHLKDDPTMVPMIVHQIADYREELGYCHTIWNGNVMPGVIHFYPQAVTLNTKRDFELARS